MMYDEKEEKRVNDVQRCLFVCNGYALMFASKICWRTGPVSDDDGGVRYRCYGLMMDLLVGEAKEESKRTR